MHRAPIRCIFVNRYTKPMEIEVQNGSEDGRFIARDNEKEVGKLIYSWSASGAMVIEHTEVYPGNQGRGYGLKLVEAAVDYARTNKIKIVPMCSFARRIFASSTEFADVL